MVDAHTSSSERVGPGCLLVVGLVLMVNGIVGWRVLARRAAVTEVTAEWPTTQGIIQKCQVLAGPQGEELDLLYVYEVQGEERLGRRVHWMGWQGDLRAVPERYRPGMKVKVHYEPDPPHRAVLEVEGGGRERWVNWGGQAFLLLVGGIGLWHAIRNGRRLLQPKEQRPRLKP